MNSMVPRDLSFNSNDLKVHIVFFFFEEIGLKEINFKNIYKNYILQK